MSTYITGLNLNAAAATGRSSAGALTLEATFRKHFKMVYETALHVTGNKFDADDVVQNTFFELIRRSEQFGELRNPAGYLRRAARNQALKIVRARRSVPLDEEQAQPVQAETTVAPEGNKQKQLLDFMATLKPAAALIMKLRYIERKPNKEIAQTLGTSQAVVAVTLMRLRRRLKKIGKGEL